jgi:NhaP-type Na+/H+ or K+/H+ antiporter
MARHGFAPALSQPAHHHEESGDMALFESTLTLVLIAIFLLQMSRSLTIPYPTLLALAGVIVAALPWAPAIEIDPQLAMALFIAPALLNASFEFPPQMLKRFWRPLLALAGMAVLVTTAAVAWVGVTLAGLPLAAAIALGAIVAPSDAAAAAAMLGQLDLPHRRIRVLEGESLLNDAVALLIFSAAVGAVSAASLTESVPRLCLAVPLAVPLGIGLAWVKIWLYPRMIGTLRNNLFEFAATFAVWIIAERLHLSAVIAVVTFAMTLGRYMPARQTPLDRMVSYAVWEVAGFLFNVLAFLLLGLQARSIVEGLTLGEFWGALGFALAVLATVIGVRLAWLLIYHGLSHLWARWAGGNPAPAIGYTIFVGWCGMRGLVTLATALALPPGFPGRDLIVLTALTVVLGTLGLQGLTLAPLVKRLRFAPDDSFERELAQARVMLLDAAVESLDRRQDETARKLSAVLAGERRMAENGHNPREVGEAHRLRRRTLIVERRKLLELRRSGAIEDDVFHALLQELDLAELAVSPAERFRLVEG